MAGEARFYWQLEERVNGLSTLEAGSVTSPVRAFATDGGRRRRQSITIDAGDVVTIYSWASTGHGFDLVVIQPSGYCLVAWKSDTFAAGVPSEDNEDWDRIGVSCNATFQFCGDDNKVAVDETAAERSTHLSTAFPTGDLDGKIIEIAIKNPGTSSITVDFIILD